MGTLTAGDLLSSNEERRRDMVKLWDELMRDYPKEIKTIAIPNKGDIKVSLHDNGNIAGTYNYPTGNIVLHWLGIKKYANNSKWNVLDIIVSVISHETLHYVLHKEHDFETTWKMDIIAGFIDWYSEDIHAGFPLEKVVD